MSEKSPNRIMTVPGVLESGAPVVECTGNEYVSLPEISPADGSIKSINALFLEARGLIEFSGGSHPLFSPVLSAGGQPAGGLKWSHESDWIPCFKADAGDVLFSGKILAPPGHKGFIYILTARNGGNDCVLDMGLDGDWAECSHVVFTRKRMNAERRCRYSRWTGGLICEAVATIPLMAMAVSASQPLDSVEVAAGEEPFGPPHTEIAAVGTDSVQFRLRRRFVLPRGQSETLAFYISVNLEGDGAGTTGVDLARHGWQSLLSEAAGSLAAMHVPHSDPVLERVLNRNLLFCHYFAFGRSLDGEALVPLTSRSPRYYVSAAFWARDTLLWAFPALLLGDSDMARELLLTCFSRYIRNAGVHALYIDGTVLYPGFELDELAAYVVALEAYVRQAGDDSLLQSRVIVDGLESIEEVFWGRRHPRHTLFSTFLHPSDDPIVYPYLTYDNVLAWRALRYMACVHERAGRLRRSHRCQQAAEQLKREIRELLVVDGPFGPMFCWSADLEGHHLLYDDAPGGLQLIAHYEFCEPGDPVYQNTVKWAYSSHNPFCYSGAAFDENGCEHASHPWLLHVANSLLGCRPEQAEDFLRRAPLDNGLVCETVFADSGRVATGAAFATCAGFIAYALRCADKRHARKE